MIMIQKEYSLKKLLKFNLEKNDYSNLEIKNVIEKTINSQLISDVPLALSLSGGVDSNVIYSVMRKRFNNHIVPYNYI